MSEEQDLTRQQLTLLEHTLGGKDPEKWYRNYFVASPGHTDLKDLRALESMGLMKTMKTPTFLDDDSIVFMVTESGKDLLTANFSAFFNLVTPEKRDPFHDPKSPLRKTLGIGDTAIFDNGETPAEEIKIEAISEEMDKGKKILVAEFNGSKYDLKFCTKK